MDDPLQVHEWVAVPLWSGSNLSLSLSLSLSPALWWEEIIINGVSNSLVGFLFEWVRGKGDCHPFGCLTWSKVASVWSILWSSTYTTTFCFFPSGQYQSFGIFHTSLSRLEILIPLNSSGHSDSVLCFPFWFLSTPFSRHLMLYFVSVCFG